MLNRGHAMVFVTLDMKLHRNQVVGFCAVIGEFVRKRTSSIEKLSRLLEKGRVLVRDSHLWGRSPI